MGFQRGEGRLLREVYETTVDPWHGFELKVNLDADFAPGRWLAKWEFDIFPPPKGQEIRNGNVPLVLNL